MTGGIVGEGADRERADVVVITACWWRSTRLLVGAVLTGVLAVGFLMAGPGAGLAGFGAALVMAPPSPPQSSSW